MQASNDVQAAIHGDKLDDILVAAQRRRASRLQDLGAARMCHSCGFAMPLGASVRCVDCLRAEPVRAMMAVAELGDVMVARHSGLSATAPVPNLVAAVLTMLAPPDLRRSQRLATQSIDATASLSADGKPNPNPPRLKDTHQWGSQPTPEACGRCGTADAAILSVTRIALGAYVRMKCRNPPCGAEWVCTVAERPS